MTLVLLELRLKLEDELVDNSRHGFLVERAELNDRVEAVAKLRREQFLDELHRVGRVILVGKPDRRAAHLLGARVRRHDDRDVAEISLAAVVVGQRAVVHDLEQQVEGLPDAPSLSRRTATRLCGCFVIASVSKPP